MNKQNILLLLKVIGFLLLFTGCKSNIKNELLEVDHVLIWVKDPALPKSKIKDLGFTAVPDSLSQIHKGQGTTGRYFNFLNTYLELIYVNDSTEFQNNIKSNPSLDFEERANNSSNEFSPFGIGLKMKKYSPNTIPFKTIEYHQDWMGGGNSIYAASDSKKYKSTPSIFVVYPEIASDEFKNLEDLSKIPEEYSIWREFFKHKNGVQKITKLVYTLQEHSNANDFINEIDKIEMIDFKIGDTYLLEIHFDNHKQNKTFDLRPELPLKIYM